MNQKPGEKAPHRFSCQDDHDPNSLPIATASDYIMSTVPPITGTEEIPLRKALHRILAKKVGSTIAVPGHANSAMDGYALRLRDVSTGAINKLKLVGKSLAGQPYTGTVNPGECVRITTGAPLPAGCDTVVIQEQAERNGNTVTINGDHREGQNIRRAGEDISPGETVIRAGKHLNAADLGLIASVGVSRVTVTRQIEVAFFSTGNELRPVGTTLLPGQIHDSNRYTLFGMLQQPAIRTRDLGIVEDDRDALRDAFEDASTSDVIITSGGVSVGEADYVKEILAETGKVHFWKVSVKPGRPFTFGQLGNAMYFGLPGNPVSVMVTFYMLVKPALRAMTGEHPRPSPLKIYARTLDRLRKRPGRVEFQRGVLGLNDAGEYSVKKTGAQGSGILSSMARANCLVVLKMDDGEIKPGEMVETIPFDSLY